MPRIAGGYRLALLMAHEDAQIVAASQVEARAMDDPAAPRRRRSPRKGGAL